MSSSSESGRSLYDFVSEQQTERLLTRRLGRDWRERLARRQQRELEEDTYVEEAHQVAVGNVRRRMVRALEPVPPTLVRETIGDAVVSYCRHNEDPANVLLRVRPELGRDHPSNAMRLHPWWTSPENAPFFGPVPNRNAWDVDESAVDSDFETEFTSEADTESEAEMRDPREQEEIRIELREIFASYEETETVIEGSGVVDIDEEDDNDGQQGWSDLFKAYAESPTTRFLVGSLVLKVAFVGAIVRMTRR